MPIIRHPNVRAERPTRYSDHTSSLGKSGRIPGPLQRMVSWHSSFIESQNQKEVEEPIYRDDEMVLAHMEFLPTRAQDLVG